MLYSMCCLGPTGQHALASRTTLRYLNHTIQWGRRAQRKLKRLSSIRSLCRLNHLLTDSIRLFNEL